MQWDMTDQVIVSWEQFSRHCINIRTSRILLLPRMDWLTSLSETGRIMTPVRPRAWIIAAGGAAGLEANE